ncbi:MAG TPA: kinase [Candidatus Limivivens merdigallinarum]|uniref:Kinase n=1 Tax=Candidatus Limivivens merdigallinarum TaxID=2840859 RepID=A0A9D0ZVE6_9FIRM|nr:kinase [Candidatus Limivivens merdigallinarum]
MRLKNIQNLLKERKIQYTYTEEDGLGSIDFEYRGVSYHIWEFEDGAAGAESNLRSGGRMEEFTGDYEEQLLEILQVFR